MTLTALQSLSLVTAATVWPVTTDEVNEQLRIDSGDDAQLINRLIAAATSYVDGLGVLGRAMINQTWRQVVQNPGSKVDLRMHPVQSLSAVKYYDASGVLQTDTLGNYRLIAGDIWAYVKPTSGNIWPTAYDRPDAIQIEFVAGYGAAAENVPDGIRHALMMLIAHWYEHREAADRMDISNLPIGFDDLLNAERRAWYG